MTESKEKPDEETQDKKDPELPPEEKAPKDKEQAPMIEKIDRSKFSKDRTIILGELPKGVGIPKYFVEPDSDPLIKQVEKDEALLFLQGPFNIGTDKNPVFTSFSAKITWLGKARRFVSKQVSIGTRGTSPYKNFWKIWVNSCRFWRNQEYSGLIKDPDFIKQCFESKNWKIRIIQDEVTTTKKAEGRLMRRNVQVWLGRPFRMREAAILLGQEVPLNPGEAELILNRIKNKTVTLKKEASHIREILDKRKQQDIKRLEEVAKLAAEKAKEEKT